MNRKKVFYIISSIEKAVAFEWISEMLNSDLIDLEFVLINSRRPRIMSWFENHGIKSHFVLHRGKVDYLKSIIKTTKLLRELKPDLVHCHLIDANLIGLISAKILGIPKRIYTRHHSTFHHDSHPNAVKLDKLSNWLATDIVAISENVKTVLIEREGCDKNKIHLIHHGFDLKSFSKENQTLDLKEKYNISALDRPIIGVVSRYMEWKGVTYIIKAFKGLLKQFPDAKLILANAHGPYKKEISLELKNIPQRNYLEIEFEENLFALYQLFDIYVHTPIDSEIEAFGQTYVEALAAQIPSIFTLSGVANEFILDKENAIVVPYKDSDFILQSILFLLGDDNLRTTLKNKGLESVQPFNLKTFIAKLEALYLI